MGEKSTRSIGDIERDIARRRVDLMADVDELQRVIRHRLEWRTPIRRHPWPFLGVALAIGFVFGWGSGWGWRWRRR